MRAIGLKTRCRIGIKILRSIHAKTVASAGASVGCAGKISACSRLSADRILVSASRSVFQNNINFPRLRRPNAKMGLVFTDQFGANRVAAFCAATSIIKIALVG